MKKRGLQWINEMQTIKQRFSSQSILFPILLVTKSVVCVSVSTLSILSFFCFCFKYMRIDGSDAITWTDAHTTCHFHGKIDSASGDFQSIISVFFLLLVTWTLNTEQCNIAIFCMYHLCIHIKLGNGKSHNVHNSARFFNRFVFLCAKLLSNWHWT